MLHRLLPVAALTMLLAGPACAGLATLTESEFNANATVRFVEGLESFEHKEAPPPALTLNFVDVAGVAPTRTATLTGQDSMVDNRDTGFDAALGRKPHSGNIFWQGGVSDFEIVFTQATNAFGFWASDIGDYVADGCRSSSCTGPALELTFKYSDGSTSGPVPVVGSATNGSEAFYGFAIDGGRTIVSVTFHNTTGGADGQGFDDFMQASVTLPPPQTEVPEPTSMALIGAALLAASVGRRRRVR